MAYGLGGGGGGLVRLIVRIIIHAAIWHFIWRHPAIGWPLVALFVIAAVLATLANRRRRF